eukprot:7387978-Prymnesium_polylepis.2
MGPSVQHPRPVKLSKKVKHFQRLVVDRARGQARLVHDLLAAFVFTAFRPHAAQREDWNKRWDRVVLPLTHRAAEGCHVGDVLIAESEEADAPVRQAHKGRGRQPFDGPRARQSFRV